MIDNPASVTASEAAANATIPLTILAASLADEAHVAANGLEEAVGRILGEGHSSKDYDSPNGLPASLTSIQAGLSRIGRLIATLNERI